MSIDNVIDKFASISLNGMDKVKLMNRIDTKYVVSKEILIKILDTISKDFFILEMEGKRHFPYQSLYYDTTDDFMYKAHHNGKLNRYKIRFRKYVTSDDTFLEIKKKVKGIRTLKNRILVKKIEGSLEEVSKKFIEKHTPFNSVALESKIYTNFHRITLVSKGLTERVTIDTDLDFYKEKNKNFQLNNSAIIELKRDGNSGDSKLTAVLNHFGIHPHGMSKYCIGRALTEENLKKNTFKPKILTLNKIENGKFYYRNS